MPLDISKEIQLCKLPYLTKIAAVRESAADTQVFQRLLEVSPNLHDLRVNYVFLRPLLDDESVCLLLKQRITHLYIFTPFLTDSQSIIPSINQLVSIFPFLKHLHFCLENRYESAERLIAVILKSLSKWQSLVSFGVSKAVIKKKNIIKRYPTMGIEKFNSA